jgi:hypothetical protein
MKNTKPTLINFVFLGLSIISIICLANQYLFTLPMYEDGDLAANALQITDAKQLSEIYGNYSRWHFNHPGPFFFYIYAVGEILFHDIIPIFPSPYNSHVFIGMVLQTAFFVYCLVISYRHFPYSLFLPLALITSTVHFVLIDNSVSGSLFLSIWPPHTLFFPFACLLLTCSGVALGQIQYIPWAVLFGGILIHNHVAQPLFVIPFIFISFYIFYKKEKDYISFKKTKILIYLVTTFLLGLLFALPIFLDLFKGFSSNFVSILKYLSTSGDNKNSIQSFIYIISYWGYLSNQDILVNLNIKALLHDFAKVWYYYAIWLFFLIYILCRLVYITKNSNKKHSYAVTLIFAISGSSILSFVWALMQNGLMYNFNGHYIYAVNFCLLILFSGLLSQHIDEFFRSPKFLNLFMISLCVPVFLTFNNMHITPASENIRIDSQVDIALDFDTQKQSTKLIYFEHSNWPQAVALALSLKRKHIPFYVDGSWGFLFGKENVLISPDDENISEWDIVQNQNRSSENTVEFIGNTYILVK